MLEIPGAVNRRDLVTVLGAAALCSPASALAQQTGMRKIGVLDGQVPDNIEHARLVAFRQGLQTLGWTEGQNVQFDVRFAGGKDERFSSLATAIVKAAPDVILAFSPDAVIALQRQTRAIPIVFVGVFDPVGLGIISNFAMPGRNATGFTNFDVAITTKWLQLLKEIAPGVERVGILFDPLARGSSGVMPSIKAAAKSAKVELIEVPMRRTEDLLRIAVLGQKPETGLIVAQNIWATAHRDEIVALAARHHLPAVYGIGAYSAAGGLMSYDTDRVDQFRRAATYVDRILRGAKPGDLPVQNPTKYILTINLKTAKALGLTVPQSLLIQADEVLK